MRLIGAAVPAAAPPPPPSRGAPAPFPDGLPGQKMGKAEAGGPGGRSPQMALGSVTGQPLFSFSENGDTPESRVLPRSLPGIQTGAGLGQARSEEGSRVDRRMRSPSCGRGSQGPGWRRLPSLSFLQGPTPLAGWRRAPPPFAPSSPRRPVGCSGQASGKQNLFAVHISTPEAVGQDAGRLPELALQASRS
nr:fibril-forming collagen alpha chain-like isoform X2 [Dasypus novemcinctus]